MLRWIPYTFVRSVLFLAAGVLLALYNPDLIRMKVAVTAIFGLALLYFLLALAGRRIRRSLNPGGVALVFILLIGYVNAVWHMDSRHSDHLINHEGPVSRYHAVVTRYAEEKANSWKVEARILEVRDTVWRAQRGKVILYLSKEGFAEPFQYGDVLLVNGMPDTLDAPGNPGEFDYKAFLAAKNIFHQHFVRAGEAAKIGYAPPNRFVALAFKGREWADNTLKKFVHGAHEQAIASALVLGVTDGLDNELTSAYGATGTMHILAVSGLHVSILYLILLWLFKPLNRFRGGRWLVAVAALVLLWLYAFVTGLSPSVLRAVTMFSFLALGRPAARSTNVYNTLAVSAFCLLLYDPFLIRSVGFQLSYLAVLGIVYLYPRIIVLWEPQHSFMAKIWKLSVVSIAAQIATFPLGILYFHQFPNYFLLSNLLVVPVSSLILIGGLGVLVVSFMTPIAVLLGYALEWVIRFLNGAVFVMEDLPLALTENIFITPGQCVLLIAFLMVLFALIEYRKFAMFLLASAIVALYAGLQWWHFARNVDVQRMVIYRIPGHSAMDLIDRGKSFFLTDSLLRDEAEAIRYHVMPNRLMSGVRDVSDGVVPSRSFAGCRLIVWNGVTILFIDDSAFRLPATLTVDCVVIANNAVPDAGEIASRIQCRNVILDSSNSYFYSYRFLDAAKFHNLDVHSVLLEGAFISQIKKYDS